MGASMKHDIRTLEWSNVVSLLIKSILGCMLPQILYAHVIAMGKVVERLNVPSVKRTAILILMF